MLAPSPIGRVRALARPSIWGTCCDGTGVRDVISFDSLGDMGRLGNQMFQYAALIAIALRRGHGFCMPPSSGRGVAGEHEPLDAFDLAGPAGLGLSPRGDAPVPGALAELRPAVISLHVRRTDYVVWADLHPPLDAG